MDAIYGRAVSDGYDAAIGEAIDLCRFAEPALARDLETLIGTGERSGKIAQHEVEDECVARAPKILVYVAMEIDEGRLGAVLARIRYLAAGADVSGLRRNVH